jgi:HK97 family phage major capsid protein
MKKINDLQSERSEIIEKMEGIATGENLTEEQRSEWTGFDSRIQAIDEEISLLQRQEELNKSKITIKNMETPQEKKAIGVEFREFLEGAINGNGKREFRVDPILSTSQAGVINKTVANSLDILTSPGEAFLRKLGVTFYTDLQGNFVIPAVAEDTAAFPGEYVAGADASMNLEALTLAARRVTHSQSITKETLLQTNPAIYSGIVQNLVDGIWKAVTYDWADTIESDAATQITATGTTATYGDLLNLEASIGGLNIGQGAYVTTPIGKALFSQMATVSSVAGPVWNNGMINGYPAYAAPAVNANRVYFGDFSRTAVGMWGPIEIIVDNVTKAKEGAIVLTALALVDTGVYNKRAIAILDASLS